MKWSGSGVGPVTMESDWGRDDYRSLAKWFNSPEAASTPNHLRSLAGPLVSHAEVWFRYRSSVGKPGSNLEEAVHIAP